MDLFLAQYKERITGVLSAPDRLIFRGTLRQLCMAENTARWYAWRGVGLGGFENHIWPESKRLKKHAEDMAKRLGRPYEHLASSKIGKQERADEIARRDKIREGLVCVFGATETCWSFRVRKDPAAKYPQLKREERRCLFLYFYFKDREFGLMHVRLQTLPPFDMQIYINGREWLALMMDREGLGYERQKNCFVSLEDAERAQKLADLMPRFHWTGAFRAFADRVNPLLKKALGGRKYFWTLREAEYATDIMFKDEKALQECYPHFLHVAITNFSSEDVLKFFERRVKRDFAGTIETDLKRLPEGIRVRHRLNQNWVKMYDKQGTVLRIETTINSPKGYRVRRQVRRGGKVLMKWTILRKGVGDFYRWVEIARSVNGRYLDAIASVPLIKPSRDILDPVSRPVIKKKLRYRALRPVSIEDSRLFASIMRGEFHLRGFRNHDLRASLFPDPPSNPTEAKRHAAYVTRKTRLLRAHGMVRKVSGSSYYRVTRRGVAIMATALNLRNYDVNSFPLPRKTA